MEIQMVDATLRAGKAAGGMREASRALALAVLPLASLALTGCGSFGGSGGGFAIVPAHDDPVALQKVEETIARSRGSAVPTSADVPSKAKEHVDAVEAAIAAQPGAAAKIEQILATGQVTPTGKPPLPVEGSVGGMGSQQVVLASHESVEPGKVEGKVEPKVEGKVEAKVEPVAEGKVDLKELKLVPAGAAEPRIEKPLAGVAMTTLGMEMKGTSAMGAMALNGMAAVEEPGVSLGAEPGLTMDAIVSQLRKQVQANPRQLNLALALQLLDGDGKPDGALGALTETDQKYVADVSAAVAAATAMPAAAGLGEKEAALGAIAKKVENDGDLKLPTLVLASRVDSYGVYSPVEAKFENGKRHTVIIYCEVANFAARKGEDGWFTTKLAQQDSLITEDGLLVWRPNPEEVEDRSRNQRRDFYLVKKLSLPESLAIGKYTLRMSVTDKQTNKIQTVSIPVEIVGR
jgi:hypothetical protein